MDKLLKVENLTKDYMVKTNLLGHKKPLRAVNNLSFSIAQGETLAIIGESGCGKSTVAKMLIGMEERSQGSIFFQEQDISSAKRSLSQQRSIQMVFQNPYSSLNPRKNVQSILEEPFIIHSQSLHDKSRLAIEALQKVGLQEDSLPKYPHMFSGGQRQRISIARATVLSPALVILDEPLSALDLSVQAQVINLLKDLQAVDKLTYLFISHDIAVVEHFANRTLVMYFGSLMESGNTKQVVQKPIHPYTQALIAASPSIRRKRNKSEHLVTGEPPSPLNPPKGCPFHSRCPLRTQICDEVFPSLRSTSDGRMVACHNVEL